MAKLVCQAGPHAGHEYALTKDRTVFGRQSSVDVQIMDRMASREQFLIRRDGQLYTLVDLESRNGTRVNGRKVTERQLEFGDKVRVGEIELVFVKETGDVELRDLLTKKYEIVEKIGEGGMGIVYKARQRSMDRLVALKVLAPKFSARPRFVEKFIDEARAAGRLNHPNIIQVHDVDSENGIHYFSMEFIEGATCMKLLKEQGAFSQEEALEIGRQIAKALAYAHENHLIHRDVKPDNIMLGTNNAVKLADLGISKTFEEAEAEGTPKKVVGTPHYMAPEAALGHRIDHRVDIYALGATLYHLLAGRTPFTGNTASDVLKGHIKKPPTPLRELNPKVHPEVERLIAEMMAKDPQKRPQTCQAVVEGIQHLQETGALAGSPAGGETVMLARFARGEAAATPAEPEAAPSRSGASTPVRSHATTGGRPGRSTGSLPGLPSGTQRIVKALLMLLIAALSIALAVTIIRTVFPLGDGDQPVPPKPGGGSSSSSGGATVSSSSSSSSSSGGTTVTPAGKSDLWKAQRLAVEGLSRRLDNRPDGTGLDEIRRELDSLFANAADQEIRDRIETVRKSLVEAVATQQAAGERSRWLALQDTVRGLVKGGDFDNAIEQVKAFAVGKGEPIAGQARELVASIEKDKADFAENVRHRLKQALGLKDARRLRELRDGLPAGLRGSALEDEIKKALSELDQQLAAKRQEWVAECAKAVRGWQIDEVRLNARKHADELEETAEGKEMVRLLALTDVLERFIRDFDAKVRAMEKKPRFRGTLHSLRDPDVSGAEANGLVLTPLDGSTAVAPWSRLTAAELDTVLRMVMSEDELKPYREALDFTRPAPAKE